MKERPILFSGEMVRAILEGRKTMTRRVIKPQPAGEWAAPGKTACPYGQPGDRLWVRETWRKTNWTDEPNRGEWRVFWRATEKEDSRNNGLWRPSIHMPRWASRILLEVVSVRVERVQDISEEDARAEGVEWQNERPCWVNYLDREDWSPTARDSFRTLWDSINAKRGYGWDANPWVWVVEFKKIEAVK